MFLKDCCIDIALNLSRIRFDPSVMVMACCSLLLPCGLRVHGLAAIPTKFSAPYAQTCEGLYLCYSKTYHFFSSICTTKSLQTSKHQNFLMR